MPELYNAVAIHYGDYARDDGRRHPYDEDMYVGRHELRDALAKHGIDLVVTHRTSAINYDAHDQLPSIEVDFNPTFERQQNGCDKLVDPNWQPGDLQSFALVLDRDVENFDNNIRTPVAQSYGIGLPQGQTINHHSIQEYGNQKVAKTLPVLEACGIAAPTYTADQMEQLFDLHGVMEAITKPPDAALGKGIVIHNSWRDLRSFIDANAAHRDHLIQPMLDTSQPFPGIKPLTAGDAELFAALNSLPDRAREIRYNFGGRTDSDGTQHLWAYPVLRVASEAGERVLGAQSTYIGVEPEDTFEQLYMRDKAIQVASTVLKETGALHIYGSTDFAWAVNPRDGGADLLSFDANMRSPHLPLTSPFARQAFIDMIANVARDNLSRQTIA